MNTSSDKGDIEKIIRELIIYFRAKNDPEQMLVFFNNIKSQLGIDGVIKLTKNGKLYLEKEK
jgi:hypothetical protein